MGSPTVTGIYVGKSPFPIGAPFPGECRGSSYQTPNTFVSLFSSGGETYFVAGQPKDSFEAIFLP